MSIKKLAKDEFLGVYEPYAERFVGRAAMMSYEEDAGVLSDEYEGGK